MAQSARSDFNSLCLKYGIPKQYEWLGSIPEWKVLEGALEELHVSKMDQADFSVLWTTHPLRKQGGFRPTVPLHTFEVDHIPDKFLVLFDEKGSVHASSLLNSSSKQEQAELIGWIRDNMVFPQDFELDHDHSIVQNSANTFSDAGFVARGFKVFDVGQDATMTGRVKFVECNDRSRYFDLSGRPDYIITHSKNADGIVPTKADCLFTALCIVEVQSKHREEDIPLCEIQLQLYLFMAMNVNCLPAAIGFLVQDDGMCRTYRATRQPKAIVYQQNDLVHVSHLPEVLEKLIAPPSLTAHTGTGAAEKEHKTD